MVRAYQAGWGGWSGRPGEDPAAVNVSSRYSAHFGPNRQVHGINNIELITDRSLEINLREIAQVKKDWPDRALIVSLMVPCVEESWKYIPPLVEATGADGIELNFGCPHGMPERGMGAAVGQVPEYVEMVTRWCKTHCSLPVIVKLTPNITDIRQPARAAHRGGADAVSLINTINSITSVDLERMVALPVVGTQSTHGGYRGSAVKPIALNMVAEIARDPQTRGLPICGIGGIGSWRDAAEFVALGCGAVQVCTAAMLHGFRIVEDMQDGLARWMDSHGYQRLSDFSGGAVGNTTDWKYLDINYQVIARIDQDACIGSRPLPYRLRGHLAPGHRQPAPGRRYAPLRSDRRRVRAATCARSPVRWRTASKWCRRTPASPISTGPRIRATPTAKPPERRAAPASPADAALPRAGTLPAPPGPTTRNGVCRIDPPSTTIRRGPADAPGRPAPHGDSRMSADSNYSQQPVLAARKSALALSVVMLGLTFFPPACGPAAPSAPA